MFKKRRGINLPYEKQGLIYFTCMNYDDMPKHVQDKISYLCKKVGKEHAKALFEVLTDSNKSIHSLAMEHHIGETQLYYYRRKFYEAW